MVCYTAVEMGTGIYVRVEIPVPIQRKVSIVSYVLVLCARLHLGVDTSGDQSLHVLGAIPCEIYSIILRRRSVV